MMSLRHNLKMSEWVNDSLDVDLDLYTRDEQEEEMVNILTLTLMMR